MTNNVIKNKIRKTLEKEGVSINNIQMRGINKTENECIINKTIINLDVPNDDDVANILYCRELLDTNENIQLVNIFIGL